MIDHRRRNADAFWQTLQPHERALAAKGGRRSKHSGLTRAETAVLLARQQGCCAICKKELTLAATVADHCHKTGAVRGALCDSCNRAIGFLKDDPKACRAAGEYIEYHAERHSQTEH